MATRVKSRAKITLEHLLKRRKTTVEAFVRESNCTSYEQLDVMCNTLGVITPEASTCSSLFSLPHKVSNPQEGITIAVTPGFEEPTPLPVAKPKKKPKSSFELNIDVEHSNNDSNDSSNE